MKQGEFKLGQLATVDNVVYRCQKAEYPRECENCDIEIDFKHGFVERQQLHEICIRCQDSGKNFKKLKVQIMPKNIDLPRPNILVEDLLMENFISNTTKEDIYRALEEAAKNCDIPENVKSSNVPNRRTRRAIRAKQKKQ